MRDPTNGGSGAHILLSPDGTLVFASIRGHNSISSYKVNAAMPPTEH
ncbi:MAG: beta-propeller fold lactonase family protein [Deltaproteobacteria bacterium]|nr:beta-propeller fold lactonase family protein [Deltaproteobacteria bacterium]